MPLDRSASGLPVTIPSVLTVIDGVPGGTLPGGLRVLEQLDVTPEGPLYRASYPSGLEVALVILPSDAYGGDAAALARQRQWFDRALQIQHPNVAAVHEMGEIGDGSIYIVLEDLAGDLLSDILDDRGALPLQEAVDLCLQVAAGLQAAHHAGLVHGNLSPHTVLVTQLSTGRSRVKLIRFRPHDSGVSPEYASPERLAGGTPDERSDVFSLGALVHHLLTGAPPGLGGDGSLPEALDAVIRKALDPVPVQRYQAISSFATAVERAAAAAGKRRMARVGLRVLGAAAAVLVVATGLWLLRSSQWPATAAIRVSETGSSTPASAAPPVQAPAARPPAPPPPVIQPTRTPPAAHHEAPPPEKIREAAAAATARLDEMRRRSQIRATTPAPVSPDVAAETAGRSIETGPAPAPAAEPPPPTMEERGKVYLRVGLDEASRQLGGPIHAIEGMSPALIGLAQGRLLADADSTQAVVRAVYLDPNGGLILLDQQRIRPGQRAPVATRDRWAVGNVMLYLHGDATPQVIGNLRARVR